MPLRMIPGSDIRYFLVTFDKNGTERRDDPDRRGGCLSETVVEALSAEPITDVFILSHGWKGDIPAAKEQYDAWISAWDRCAVGRRLMMEKRSKFRPLSIGIHWPSLPWGDEEFARADSSFAPEAIPSVEALVETYAGRFGDTPSIRAALTKIIVEARHNAAATELSPVARDAYLALDREIDLGTEGVGAAPGADRLPFDPDQAFENGNEAASFGGGFDLGGVLGPLRQLSFWTMKKRGRMVGEGGVHNFIVAIMTATAGRSVRYHLMGHSFGCIVVSAALGGPAAKARLPQPAASLMLVQGALSLWAYCPDIPGYSGRPGYFAKLIADGKVAGPIVTTRSQFDSAVGIYYPLGAGVARQVDLAPIIPEANLPEFGGLGTFGLRGIAGNTEDLDMREASDDYGFRPGRIYNLEASRYICHGDGPSGAHCDIAGQEVASAMWAAAAAI
jgi:hypothetical protein